MRGVRKGVRGATARRQSRSAASSSRIRYLRSTDGAGGCRADETWPATAMDGAIRATRQRNDTDPRRGQRLRSAPFRMRRIGPSNRRRHGPAGAAWAVCSEFVAAPGKLHLATKDLAQYQARSMSEPARHSSCRDRRRPCSDNVPPWSQRFTGAPSPTRGSDATPTTRRRTRSSGRSARSPRPGRRPPVAGRQGS